MTGLAPQMPELLSHLVRFPSVSEHPNGPIVEFVAAYLAEHGIAAMRLPGPEGDRDNLFATIGPKDRPGYLLSAHLDVVPAADQPGWRADPFLLRREGVRLIGRGTSDMKGFVAAVLSAVPDLIALAPQVPIHIALSYDEEVGCKGVPHLIAALPGLCARPLGCVIGEPTGLVPVLGHKGKATLRLRASGVAGHSARPDLGRNAIHGLVPVLNAALTLVADLGRGPRHGAYSPPVSTAQIGTLAGGTAVNVIPDRAEALVELRALPSEDPVQLLAPVIEVARHAGVAADIIAQYPGLETPQDSALVRLLGDVTGAAPQAAVSFGTEAGLFAQAGLPAVVCGPGDIGRAHKPEEYITLSELDGAREFVMRLATQGQMHPWAG